MFIIVQTDLGHLFALKHGSGSTSPDVVTSLEIYVLLSVNPWGSIYILSGMGEMS